MLWLNGEDLSGELLLPGEVVLDWILAFVLNGDGVLLWFANSDSSKIKDLSIVLVGSDDVYSTNGDGWRDLESLSVDLDDLGFLLNTVALCVFNFKRNLGLEFVLLLCLKCDLNHLFLAWLEDIAGVRNSELWWELFHTCELPFGWDRTNVLKGESLGKLLAK